MVEYFPNHFDGPCNENEITHYSIVPAKEWCRIIYLRTRSTSGSLLLTLRF
jgi:hypothetical protein